MSGAVCATGVAFGASGAVLRVSVVIGIVTTGTVVGTDTTAIPVAAT